MFWSNHVNKWTNQVNPRQFTTKTKYKLQSCGQTKVSIFSRLHWWTKTEEVSKVWVVLQDTEGSVQDTVQPALYCIEERSIICLIKMTGCISGWHQSVLDHIPSHFNKVFSNWIVPMSQIFSAFFFAQKFASEITHIQTYIKQRRSIDGTFCTISFEKLERFPWWFAISCSETGESNLSWKRFLQFVPG